MISVKFDEIECRHLVEILKEADTLDDHI